MHTRALSLASLTSLATTQAVAEVSQHAAVFAPRSLPGVNPWTIMVCHPASPQFVAGHATYAHPAVSAQREARELDQLLPGAAAGPCGPGRAGRGGGWTCRSSLNRGAKQGGTR
jgi:hypothetical protein